MITVPPWLDVGSVSLGTAADADIAVRGVFSDDLADSHHRHQSLARLTGFDAAAGSCRTLFNRDQLTIVVGLGPRADLDVETLRATAATAGRESGRGGTVEVDLVAVAGQALTDPVAARAVAEGLLDAAYLFTAHRSERAPRRLPNYVLSGVAATAAVRRELELAALSVEAVSLARDLVNTPPGHLSPADFAAVAVDVAEREHLTVRVLGPAELAAERMGGIVAIGQGAQATPRLVVLSYEPSDARGTLALVGKGVTFDSGGLSLKSPDAMMTMKLDMAGAAAVLGVLSVIARTAAPVTVRAYLPLAENMPGPGAVRPGDVITTRSGRTLEILNTDFEGRVVLADALSLACEAGPDLVVDIATLTDACTVALGDDIAGLFGNDPAAIAAVEEAARSTGEAVWALPLARRYTRRLRSTVADTTNFPGNRTGRAITAALFLEQFVTAGTPWAHLDVVGPAWHTDAEDTPGATGFGVRTLLRLIEAMGSSDSNEKTVDAGPSRAG